MAVERVRSWIASLDEMLKGGIPVDSNLALLADPDVSVELFLQSFAYQGLRDGEGLIYSSATKPPDRIRKEFAHWNRDLREFERDGQVIFVNMADTSSKGQNVINVDSRDYTGVSVGINEAIDMLDPELYPRVRGLCDSTGDALFTLDLASVLKFAETRRAKRREKPMVSLHTLLSGIRDDLVEPFRHHADGVFEIAVEATEEEIIRRFRVSKMHFTGFDDRTRRLIVTEGDIQVLPFF
ncbi:MAG: RAD55 family ATPase [Thermoplasmata archaeon]